MCERQDHVRGMCIFQMPSFDEPTLSTQNIRRLRATFRSTYCTNYICCTHSRVMWVYGGQQSCLPPLLPFIWTISAQLSLWVFSRYTPPLQRIYSWQHVVDLAGLAGRVLE